VDSSEDRAAAAPVHRTAKPAPAKRADAAYVVVRPRAAPQAEQKGA
jgi:hypothetical protein